MIGLIETNGCNPTDGPAIGYFQDRGSFRAQVGDRVVIAHVEQFSTLFCCQADKSSFHRSGLLGNMCINLVAPFYHYPN
jgi:hypothetical protein